MKRIIFWQGILSIHQSALLRNVANMPEFDVMLVVEQEADPERLAMGWHRPDFGNCKIIIQPSDRLIVNLIEQDIKETVHIFSGINPITMAYKAFKQAIKLGANIGVYAETVNWLGIKGKMRWIRDRLYVFRYSDKIDFMLAIGDIAVRWFSRIGYPIEKIYPFGYFTENRLFRTDLNNVKYLDSPINDLCFIGQLINRKGVDLLIKALGKLNSLNFRLKIIGEGHNKAEYMSLCKVNQIEDKVLFLGAIKNNDAIQILSKSDLFILPSRWDGWGAVVNEALMQGVPVICSDYCGAADLIANSARGEIVTACSIESLRGALERRIQKGHLGLDERKNIREWAKCISGESAATYLKDILAHVYENSPRPIAPWFV